MRSPQFLRHAAIYGTGTLLVNACGILLLPLYLHCLTPGEYGVLDWLRSVSEIVLICLLFGGVKQALLSFHGQSETELGRRRSIGAALALAGGVALTAALVTSCFGGVLAQALRWNDTPLLQATIVVVLLEGLSGVLMTCCQARLESSLFMVLNVGQFLLRVVLSILLVATWRWGIWGLLAASAATAGLTTTLLMCREFYLGGLFPDRATLFAMVRFALPFVPGGLGFFLLHSGDRFFLKEHATVVEMGLYALGYKLAFAVSQFSRSPLYMVWNTQMHAVARQPDAAIVFGRAFSRILAAYLAVGLGLCLVADELVVQLGGEQYSGAAAVIPTVVLAYFCLTAADLMDAGFYVSRRTGWKTPITLASTAMMLVLYATMIPPWGGLGAALATLFGFMFHAGLTWWTTQRIFRVRYEWGRCGAALLLAICAWALALWVPKGFWSLPIKVLLWPTWIATLWFVGIVSAEEKHLVAELIEVVWRRLPFRRAPALVDSASGQPEAA